MIFISTLKIHVFNSVLNFVYNFFFFFFNCNFYRNQFFRSKTMINDEPVRVAIQQGSQMIEETLAANMRRFKGGSTKRRDIRRKRSTHDSDNHLNSNLYNQGNQGKLYTDDNSYYRQINNLDKVQPSPYQFQYPFAHYNHQQSYQQQQQQQQQLHFQQQQFNFQQQQQAPPTSPLLITPPIPSSHPLSSFQAPNQQAPNSNGLYVCP